MKTTKQIKLPLTAIEKNLLKKNKIKISDITNLAADELEILLNISPARSKELIALCEFQKIPSIGIRFTEDLVFMGYYSVSDLRDKDGSTLTDDFEQKKGYWIDPCVEDQFRLIVYYANTFDSSKRWYDFTEERKKFRSENGYPKNRPQKAWHEIIQQK